MTTSNHLPMQNHLPTALQRVDLKHLPGYVRYRRGHITVLDRAGLQARTCECYTLLKKGNDHLLPETRAPQKQMAVAH